MLSNLKIRSLLIGILALFSALVLCVATLNWDIGQTLSRDFLQLKKLSVEQADHLHFAQIFLLRATSRVDGGTRMATAAQRRAEINTAREFLRNAQSHFAEYEKSADSIPEGRALHAKIKVPYQRYVDGLEHMMTLLLNGGTGEQMNALKYEEVVPAAGDYVALLDEFGKISDAMTAEADADQERLRGLSFIMLPVFILLALVVSVGSMLFLNRHVLQPLKEANRLFDRIAAGDLTERVTIHSQNEIGQLFQSLERMQTGLTRTVSQVRGGVDELQHSVHEIYSGNLEISSRTEQQASALQETAASMEELSGTLRQNTDNAEQADQLAMNASRVAQAGGQAVEQVVDIMQDISTNSDKVAEIVSVIDGIAFQTNILALNAAVEAARAGDQGKGFAVVASEVRSLAQRSAQAAREIKDLIEGSLQTIRKGATEAGQAGEVIQELVTSVEGVTTLMKEISLASREQAEGIGQVNVAVSQMDTAVQQNAALVGQTTTATAHLQEQSDKLSQAVAVFKLQDH